MYDIFKYFRASSYLTIYFGFIEVFSWTDFIFKKVYFFWRGQKCLSRTDIALSNCQKYTVRGVYFSRGRNAILSKSIVSFCPITHRKRGTFSGLGNKGGRYPLSPPPRFSCLWVQVDVGVGTCILTHRKEIV